MPNNTLEKWEEKTLGEILDKGSSNLSANKLNDCVGIYPVYGASGLIAKVNFYQQDKEYLAIIKDGAGVGRVYLYQPKTSVLGTLQYLYPKPNTNIRFAYYYLQSIDFAKYYQGAAIPHIYYRDYKSEKLVLPPLPEQERIVAKLDEAFEAIDKAKFNAEQNLTNAKELFDGYLENIVAPKDKLGKYIKITTGKLNSNVAVENGQYPFFTCSRTPLRINNFAFDCEAILLAGNNASGDFNVKHYKGKFNAYQRTYVITIPDKSKLNYRYLYFQLFKALAELKKMSLGANTKFLRVGMITDFMLSMPTIEEQQKIVEQLDKIQEQTKQLEAIYTQKIKECDELKQSILQKAFRGEL